MRPGGSGSCLGKRRTSCDGLPTTFGTPPTQVTLGTLAFFRLPPMANNNATRAALLLDVRGWSLVAPGHQGDSRDAGTVAVSPSCSVRRFGPGEETYVAFPPFVVSATDAGAYRFSFDGGGDGYASLSFADCGDAELGTSSSETSCFGGGPTATGIVEAEWDLSTNACFLVRWGSLRGAVDTVAVELVGPFNETRARERSAAARARPASGGFGVEATVALVAGVVALSAMLACVAVEVCRARRFKARETGASRWGGLRES